MNQNKVLPLGIIAVGVVAAAVTGYQSRNLGTSSSVAKSQIPSDAVTVTGSAQGMVGPVSVELIATADKIYSINVTEANETENIGTMAIDQLPASIFEANSLKVDAVTGATITSNAIIQASVQALESAGFDPAAYGGAGSSDAKEDTETTASETESATDRTSNAASDSASGDSASAQSIATANHNAAAGNLTGVDAYLNRYYTEVQ